MKIIFLIVGFALSQTTVYAQAKRPKDTFTHTVTSIKGDLNKDAIEDTVIVTQDTLQDTAPYRIQVFFGTESGGRQLIVTSEKLIDPQYPNGKGGFISGNGFSGIEIKKGILIVSNELLRGHYEYKFRYQNDNFELIGYTYVSSDGLGMMYSVDFNLSTGMRFSKSERYDSDKVISDKKEKVLIRPLPKLQDIIPFEQDWQ